ncbi:type II toxin-antitoxin system PemK/MazF family toxin [uncultured Brevundimonas sp.]|uniref:type II toxin-antitoxin system PemK/MazF family toxin n=1 Tax=uncultured Brevundimonas sp. TaxID=213418 RepID=UPI00262008CF|nr:type II toxin-antitoxin system PemK/MazF family toxin [uncultured Brevundimonas sp.]
MKRGDVVIAVMKGDYGKPRPAVVVQSDIYANHTSVTVAMMTTTLTELDDIRITIEPQPSNGLRETSQVLGDRVQTVRRDRIKEVIGELTPDQLTALNRALALFLGVV